MRRLTTVLVALGAFATCCSAQESGLRHVISGEDIRLAGAHRLGDILRLSPVFSSWSLDGFDVQGVVFGSGTTQSEPFRIVVDGREVRYGMMGQTHLETLPVAAGEVDRVILLPPGPGPFGLSAGGWVVIETAPPDSSGGLLHYAVGNEVGDPGPFRYTDEATPNVDRVGPSAGATATMRWKTLAATGHMKADQVHLTDERVTPRVLSLYDGEGKPRMSLLQPRGQLALAPAWGALSVGGSLTTLRDLPFVDAIGAELPATRRIESLYADVMLRAGETTRISVRGSRDRLWFVKRPNSQSLTIDWENTAADLDLQVHRLGNRSSLIASAGVQTLKYLGDTSRLPRAWLTWRRWSDAGQAVAVTAQAIQADGELLPSMTLEWVLPLGTAQLDGSIGYLTSSVAASRQLPYWLNQGLSLPGRGAGRIRVLDHLQTSRSLTMDVQVSGAEDGLGWGVAGFARVLDGLTLPVSDMDPDSLFQASYLADVAYHSGLKGQVMGIRTWVSQGWGAHMNHRVDYQYQRSGSGGLAFWQSASPLPRIKLNYRLSISPVQRTWVSFQIAYRSATSWPTFRTSPGSAERERLPAAARIDLLASKRLWASHLTVYAKAQNLARARVRSHPLAPMEDLTFSAGIRARL